MSSSTRQTPRELIILHLDKFNSFTRKGDDLQSTVSIPFYDLILGTSVQVETMDGKIEMKIPL